MYLMVVWVCITSMRVAATDASSEGVGNKSQGEAEIVITGSLIPQSVNEIAQPVTVITPADIQERGLATVAEAVQHSPFATGAIQNPQESGTFTPSAQVVSFFGLSPSYTKFLIDGRPMADYPALYNGTDTVASITGIPTVLVESIDLLPGGQSSIYGSDAIAGVVNIHLRHKLDEPVADLRYGWTQNGGGTERRLALADGFSLGSFDAVIGGQYERTDPIWGYQRPLSNQYFADGSSPQTAERDWLVIGLYGQPDGDLYYMLDPASCNNVASQFGNSVALRSRGDRGQYCGTFRSGFATINNGTEATQGFVHLSGDINSNAQIFADILLDHDVTRFNNGPVSLQTSGDTTGPYYYFVDPNVQGGADLLNLQHAFSPEEAGHLGGQDSKNTINSIRATLGAQGNLGASGWKYLADMSFTENRLTEAYFLAFAQAINSFYAPIFGPNLGPDPTYGQPQYTVNYSAFYKPISPASYASFTGYAYSYSRTEESLARAELTNAALFNLPGGDAGLAALIEGGAQGWDYAPDPRYLDGQTYLVTSSAGSGHRSRYAGTLELRLPVAPMITVHASDRYDNYRVSSETVHKDTYNIGLEIRPVGTILIRGKWGTAFKAPTLSDEFQGVSGTYKGVTDYFLCTQLGYTAAAGNLSNCPYAGTFVLGTTAGNPHLHPITANVSGAGIDWMPASKLQMSVDYLHWYIRNEVQQENSDQLLRLDSACLLGEIEINSPTCLQATSQVTRDANGLITQVNLPKINVAEERLGVLIASFNFSWQAGAAGSLSLQAAYSDLLQHSELRFAGDTPIDLLNSPFYSTEFKSKANASATWEFNHFGTTLYIEHYGRTPNYLSQTDVSGYALAGAGRLPAWTVANLSMKYELATGVVVSGNVINLTNKLPPIDHSTPGLYSQPFNVENFNNYGRSYFLEASYHLVGR